MASENLQVSRRIAASAERLFSAWTTPAQLLSWWGPQGVQCTLAEVDLRPGGRYRLDNLLPTGEQVSIIGEFLVVEPPRQLVYTWRVGEGPAERVTVRFQSHGAETDVLVTHERIPNEPTRNEHEIGWRGCLRRLSAYLR